MWTSEKAGDVNVADAAYTYPDRGDKAGEEGRELLPRSDKRGNKVVGKITR